MAALTRHGSDVASVFDLLGRDENDLTAALGFTLTNCSPLLAALINRVQPKTKLAPDEQPRLALERRDSEGRTDLEIQTSNSLLICEAKRGWILPSTEQLHQYSGRIHRRGPACQGELSPLVHSNPACRARYGSTRR